MARTDSGKLPEAGRHEAGLPAEPVLARQVPIPRESLAKLGLLHAEAACHVSLGRFVANSVTLAGLLMLMGGASLLAGGGTLASDFVWSVLVLAGVTAITVNFIRGPARAPLAPPLESSAADLRAILLYTGFAWGAGAFLALPADPGPGVALGFAIAPALLARALLKDRAGIAAFCLPAIGLTAAAALLQHWRQGHVLAPGILAAGILIILFTYLETGRARLYPGRHGTA
ncbi:MAG TPA: hypothetical protein VHV26_07120 [Rhizomicrobium sp.]|jgi:hypothetical protein|nr:hypothetical protein [Rhizomicrobium sp.]